MHAAPLCVVLHDSKTHKEDILGHITINTIDKILISSSKIIHLNFSFCASSKAALRDFSS